MSHNRNFVARIALSLIQPVIGITRFDKLAFEMHPGQILAHNVRAVNTAFELDPPASLVAVTPEKLGQFEFTPLPLLPGVNHLR